MQIKQAELPDIQNAGNLFAEYRVFYNQPYEPEKCIRFLLNRIQNCESIIFLALEDGSNTVGFAQIYPSFSSIHLQKIWILNDLFVAENYRNRGIATSLLKHLLKESSQGNISKVILSTGHDNVQAQELYEKTGFQRSEYYNYEIEI